MKVIKKDGTLEDYNEQKIINAVHKSAARAMVELTESQYADIVARVNAMVNERLSVLQQSPRRYTAQCCKDG